jgi:quercetin dioxygenase-like cupin family protein
VLLQLYAPGGPEQQYKGINVGATTKTEKVRRGDPAFVVRYGFDVPEHVIAGGKGKVRLLFEAETAPSGAPSLAELTLEPGAAVPEHVHDTSTEILYLAEGGGTMTIDGDEREVGMYTAIQIPAGVKHGFVAGEATVKAIQFYTPAGPEQRFKGK